MAESTKHKHEESDSDKSDGGIGPTPAETKPAKKRKGTVPNQTIACI